MKKLILAILFLPSFSWAAGLEIFRNPKALLNSTNTWTAAQTFSSGTFNGDLTILGNCVGCGSGGGGGGSASLAVGTGSVQAVNIISSPTSIINFSSGPFRTKLISPSTIYIDIDYSSITAQGFISASGGGGSDNLGSHVATTTFRANNQEIQNSSHVVIGATTGYATLNISSPNASILWDALSIDTGAPTPLYDFQYASATLAKPVTFYVLGPLIQGATISNQNESGGQQSYILRMGPLLNSAMINSVFNGSNQYLFTSAVNGTSRMVFMNGTGGKLEWGLGAGPIGYFGMFTNHTLQIRTNDSIVATFDTTGNLGAAASATQKVLYGYVLNTSSGVATSSFTAYGEFVSTTGFLGGGSTFTSCNVSGPTLLQSTTTINGPVTMTSSLTVVNAGTMSLVNVTLNVASAPVIISTIMVQGLSSVVPMFISTVNASVAGTNCYATYYSTYTISANTTDTFTAAQINAASICGASAGMIEIVNTTTAGPRIKSLSGLPASFTYYNPDAINAQGIWLSVNYKPK